MIVKTKVSKSGGGFFHRHFLVKDISSGVIAVGKGSTNIVKTTTTGVFGVCYELVDEVKYIIVPNTTNDSALNPDEVLTIQF